MYYRFISSLSQLFRPTIQTYSYAYTHIDTLVLHHKIEAKSSVLDVPEKQSLFQARFHQLFVLLEATRFLYEDFDGSSGGLCQFRRFQKHFAVKSRRDGMKKLNLVVVPVQLNEPKRVNSVSHQKVRRAQFTSVQFKRFYLQTMVSTVWMDSTAQI